MNDRLTIHGYCKCDTEPNITFSLEADGARQLEGKDLFLHRRIGNRVEMWPVHFESASERARREARERLALKRAIRARHTRHQALLEATIPNGVLRLVVSLHWPSHDGECMGCEGLADDEDYRGIDWPCRTFLLIENELMPESP